MDEMNQFWEEFKTPLVVIIAIILVIIGLGFMYERGTDYWITITVDEKVYYHDEKYLVFTTDMEYENADSLWWWKFNSSELMNDFEEGQTYRAHVYGWRVPFLSMYPNIISCDPPDQRSE